MSIKSVKQIFSETPNLEIPGPPWEGDSLTIFYPATAEQVCRLPEDGPQAVDSAVARARSAFDSGCWSGLPVGRRQEILRAAAGMIRAHSNELAVLETLCAGLPASHLQGRRRNRVT
jgi:aldehyde dehydrogenase (NAD+)